MKRYGNLWLQVIAFENLLRASRLAQKSKRFRPNVLAFNHRLEQELQQLQAELKTLTYQPGGYRTFRIRDPKPRMISAAPYRDRVVHHALCNVIVPLLDRTLIHDTYANRCGYGTHRALHRFTGWARQYRYGLQCDISKYFPSIDHEILKAFLRKHLKCQNTLWLIDTIIDASNEQIPVIEYFPGDETLQRQYAAGEIDLEPLLQRLQSWEAHLKHGDTYRLRQKVFERHTFVRAAEEE
ncbi:Retron-type reverse transcriptase [Leptolyngbya cf. ectocarpi LEGE 11479]|uniref:Retron-type reverse transcriptase n=1 Tax=Leptolyngbya cf. ectocarpi LEGE 11479 TaxID=1828722 RepID=A0A928ZSR8_LEPEC|nr:Retron-type reverse transcriptase [Leptolyngbya ectocarpi]MBE9065666.1 Retron-type reverse transcriptase [Leptolyngbya cf. ectocarpi LEGE 11479]